MREAYLISSLFTILIALFFGCLIFFRGRGGRVVKSYFLLMVFVALWAAGLFNMIATSSFRQAFLWGRLLFISAVFIPALYFRFIMKLLAAEKRYRVLLWLGYFISVCFGFAVLTPFIFRGTNLKFGVYWPVAGRFPV